LYKGKARTQFVKYGACDPKPTLPWRHMKPCAPRYRSCGNALKGIHNTTRRRLN